VKCLPLARQGFAETSVSLVFCKCSRQMGLTFVIGRVGDHGALKILCHLTHLQTIRPDTSIIVASASPFHIRGLADRHRTCLLCQS
jgi:hypothetical protein